MYAPLREWWIGRSRARRQELLAAPDPEAAKPLYVFSRVPAVSARRALCSRHNSEPLGKPEVAYRDTKLLSSPGYGEHVFCNFHTPIEKLIVRFF
jgi:hypothetical protein